LASERSELEWDRKDYKRDLQKVFARKLEASRREKRLAKREEALSERETLTTELWAKLKALDQTLEAQWFKQVEAIEKIKKWERELEDKANNIALAEENLKEKDVSLDRREMDLARREMDLALGRKGLKGGRCYWPSMSSRRRRRSGSWRSGSATSKQRRRRRVLRRQRMPRRP
jgi:uncharacterized protein (DUF3084 family)